MGCSVCGGSGHNKRTCPRKKANSRGLKDYLRVQQPGGRLSEPQPQPEQEPNAPQATMQPRRLKRPHDEQPASEQTSAGDTLAAGEPPADDADDNESLPGLRFSDSDSSSGSEIGSDDDDEATASHLPTWSCLLTRDSNDDCVELGGASEDEDDFLQSGRTTLEQVEGWFTLTPQELQLKLREARNDWRFVAEGENPKQTTEFSLREMFSCTVGEWLDGGVLYILLKRLALAHNAANPHDAVLVVCPYTTLRIQDPRQKYSRWVSKERVAEYGHEKLLDYKRVLFPWWVRASHWTLLHMDHKSVTLTFGDPMNGYRINTGGTRDSVLDWYSQYYRRHFPTCENEISLMRGRMKVEKAGLPQQKDMAHGHSSEWSCGTHVYMAVAFVIHTRGLVGIADAYSQEDVYDLHRSIFRSVCTKEIPEILSEMKHRWAQGHSNMSPTQGAPAIQGTAPGVQEAMNPTIAEKGLDAAAIEEDRAVPDEGDQPPADSSHAVQPFCCWSFLNQQKAKANGHSCRQQFSDIRGYLRHLNRNPCGSYVALRGRLAKSHGLCEGKGAEEGFIVQNSSSTTHLKKKTRNTKSSKSSRRKAKRQKREDDIPPESDEDPDRPEDVLSPPVSEWYKSCKSELGRHIHMAKGRRSPGKSPLQGKWPAAAGWTSYWREPPDVVNASDFCPQNYYLPRILFWAPEFRHTEEFPGALLKCKRCKSSDDMKCLGWKERPRRVLDYRDNYLITCRRYYCWRCSCTTTGFSPETLGALPRDIQLEFPAILTERAAIDVSLVDAIRMMTTSGKSRGVEGLARDIREQHLNTWARKILHYYSRWLRYQRQPSLRTSSPLQAFSLPDDEYGDWVGSEDWMLDVFKHDSGSRAEYLERQMQFVLGEIGKVDACRKIAKRIGNSEDKPIYETVTFMNEYNQVMNYWATETGSILELEEGVKGLRRRLEMHGHPGFKLLYTDRCCFDRPHFEKWLPELAPVAEENCDQHCDYVEGMESAVSGPGRRRMTSLKLPADLDTCVSHVTIGAAAEIACADIMQASPIAVGFDAEWAYEYEPESMKKKRQKVAIVQLAVPLRDTYHIYIFNISRMKFVMPKALKMLLENQDIGKAGCNIANDATHLRNDYDIEMSSSIELGAAAFKKGLVSKSKITLQELCERVLKRTLPKEEGVRRSAWSDPELSDLQMQYAALDALAGLRLHEVLSKQDHVSELPQPEQEDLYDGQELILLDRYQRCKVATAIVKQRWQGTDSTHAMLGRNLKLTKNRVLVTCSTAMSGASLPLHGLDHMSLGDLQATSGDDGITTVLWPIKLTRLAHPSDTPSDKHDDPFDGPGFRAGKQDTDDHTRTAPPDILDDVNLKDENFDLSQDATMISALTDILFEDPSDSDDDVDNIDDRAARMRIKLDAVHGMFRIEETILKSHGAYAAFLARLRDAIFIPCPSGIADIKAGLMRGGMSADEVEEKYHKEYSWFIDQVPRRIPSPADLLDRMKAVENVYAQMKDYKTGQPLFRPRTWAAWKLFKEHVSKGCLSDHPDIALYIKVILEGVEEEVLKCLRGNNALEGYHFHLAKVFAGFHVSLELALHVMREFNFRWNIRMAAAHGMIPKWMSEFTLQNILEEVQDISQKAHGKALFPEWRNTGSFVSTKEYFGILPKPGSEVSEHWCKSCEADPDLVVEREASRDDDAKSALDQYTERLAEDGDTLLAGSDSIPRFAGSTGSTKYLLELMGKDWPTPVKTEAESVMFDEMVQQFMSPTAMNPDQHGAVAFDRFARAWNSKLEHGNCPPGVYRKTESHLVSHWNAKGKARNKLMTMHSSREADSAACSYLRPDWQPLKGNANHPSTVAVPTLAVLHSTELQVQSDQGGDQEEALELGSAGEVDAQPGEVGDKHLQHEKDGGNMEAVWKPDDQLAEASQMASEIGRKGLLRQCKRCKHLLHLGVWGPLHLAGRCEVFDDPMSEDGATSSSNHSDMGFCCCPVCLDYVKLVWQHTVGEMKAHAGNGTESSLRAPKRCRMCGHHLHRGVWSALHAGAECQVPQSEYSPASQGRSWRLMCCPCAKCQKHLCRIV